MQHSPGASNTRRGSMKLMNLNGGLKGTQVRDMSCIHKVQKQGAL